MQSLNSAGNTRKALAVTGTGMFIAFLFLAPFAAFAQGTVTVTSPTAGAFVAPNSTITVSGNVNGTTGNVAVSIVSPNGETVDANQFPVTSGAFSGTFVTGGPSYTVNGTYTINFNYNGATASVQVQYGNGTTISSGSGTTTTVQITTTVIESGGATTVTESGGQTTVTQVQQGATTTVSSVIQQQTTVTLTNSASSDSTAIAIGAVGVIIAIVAIIMAVLAMRKK